MNTIIVKSIQSSLRSESENCNYDDIVSDVNKEQKKKYNTEVVDSQIL